MSDTEHSVKVIYPVSTFEKRVTTNSLTAKWYLLLTLSNTHFLKQNVGGRRMKRRKQIKIMTTVLLQKLRRCPLGYPEFLPIKLMRHASIIEVSVA